MKYRQVFGDQSKRSKTIAKRNKNDSEIKIEHRTDQSQANGTFENNNHMNETEQSSQSFKDKERPMRKRLVEQRNALSQPDQCDSGTTPNTQRTVFAPSRPNKRSKEEIAVIDAELIRRANRIEGATN